MEPEVVGSSPIGRPTPPQFNALLQDLPQALARRLAACQSPKMTHEALDQWQFVLAAYALGVGATLALVGWSWLAMRRAERRRERTRDLGRDE